MDRAAEGPALAADNSAVTPANTSHEAAFDIGRMCWVQSREGWALAIAGCSSGQSAQSFEHVCETYYSFKIKVMSVIVYSV
jgi:hypothetical protein